MRHSAWQLQLARDVRVAVAPNALIELLADPDQLPLPGASGACQNLLLWEGRLIPVFDFNAEHSADSAPITAVLGYPRQPQGSAALAIRLLGPPQRIDVSDDQHCALPTTLPEPLHHAAISCFTSTDETAIPIIRLEILVATKPLLATEDHAAIAAVCIQKGTDAVAAD